MRQGPKIFLCTMVATVLLLVVVILLALFLPGCRPQAMVSLGPGVAHASAVAGPDPLCEITKWPTEVERGTDWTVTVRVWSPASETARSYDNIVHYAPDPPAVVVKGTGPEILGNQASNRWADAQGQPAGESFTRNRQTRVAGLTEDTMPVGGELDIPIGALDPGQSQTVTVTCRVP